MARLLSFQTEREGKLPSLKTTSGQDRHICCSNGYPRVFFGACKFVCPGRRHRKLEEAFLHMNILRTWVEGQLHVLVSYLNNGKN